MSHLVVHWRSTLFAEIAIQVARRAVEGEIIRTLSNLESLVGNNGNVSKRCSIVTSADGTVTESRTIQFFIMFPVHSAAETFSSVTR
jgi:hypothetical protein